MMIYYCTSARERNVCLGNKIMNRISNLKSAICNLKSILRLTISIAMVLALAACDVERRKSDAELGLNPQQAAGRQVYDNFCDRCHKPYSSRGRQGPSMKGVFKKQYLSISGLPANNDRVTDIILFGRSKMPGYRQALSDEQVKDLLVYMHTL